MTEKPGFGGVYPMLYAFSDAQGKLDLVRHMERSFAAARQIVGPSRDED